MGPAPKNTVVEMNKAEEKCDAWVQHACGLARVLKGYIYIARQNGEFRGHVSRALREEVGWTTASLKTLVSSLSGMSTLAANANKDQRAALCRQHLVRLRWATLMAPPLLCLDIAQEICAVLQRTVDEQKTADLDFPSYPDEDTDRGLLEELEEAQRSLSAATRQWAAMQGAIAVQRVCLERAMSKKLKRRSPEWRQLEQQRERQREQQRLGAETAAWGQMDIWFEEERAKALFRLKCCHDIALKTIVVEGPLAHIAWAIGKTTGWLSARATLWLSGNCKPWPAAADLRTSAPSYAFVEKVLGSQQL